MLAKGTSEARFTHSAKLGVVRNLFLLAKASVNIVNSRSKTGKHWVFRLQAGYSVPYYLIRFIATKIGTVFVKHGI